MLFRDNSPIVVWNLYLKLSHNFIIFKLCRVLKLYFFYITTWYFEDIKSLMFLNDLLRPYAPYLTWWIQEFKIQAVQDLNKTLKRPNKIWCKLITFFELYYSLEWHSMWTAFKDKEVLLSDLEWWKWLEMFTRNLPVIDLLIQLLD